MTEAHILSTDRSNHSKTLPAPAQQSISYNSHSALAYPSLLLRLHEGISVHAGLPMLLLRCTISCLQRSGKATDILANTCLESCLLLAHLCSQAP